MSLVNLKFLPKISGLVTTVTSSIANGDSFVVAFGKAQAQLNGKANLAGGNTFTGNQNFGAAPTNIPQAPLNLVNSAAGTQLTQLNLINTGGGGGAGSSIDFHTYDVVGGTTPGARIGAVDDNFSAYLAFYTKTPGAATNVINERVRITNDGRVSINQAAPSVSAVLQADSTTQGFLMPRMTTAQMLAIASPAAGLQIFNTDVSAIATYNGTAWVFSLTEVATAVQTSTSNTYANITGLTSPPLPIGTYRFEVHGLSQSTSNNTGVGFRLGAGTAALGVTFGKWSISQAANGTTQSFQYDQLTANTNVTSASVVTANTDFTFTGEGNFIVTTAGTVAVQIRTEINGNGVSVRPGTTFHISKVA